MTGHQPWKLIATLSVEYSDRVQCQCKGCGRTIYRYIHLIEAADGELQCWGAVCFSLAANACWGGTKLLPMYPHVGGRRLTEDERRLLLENRKRLVAQVQAEYEAAERAKIEAEARASAVIEARRQAASQRGADRQNFHPALPPFSATRNDIANESGSPWENQEITCVVCGRRTRDWSVKDGNSGTGKCKICMGIPHPPYSREKDAGHT